MMKRIARLESMVGMERMMCRSVAEEEDVKLEDSGGTYRPPSRKDLIFDMRSNEEAEGERRIMGSGLLVGTLGWVARVGFLARAWATFFALKGVASLRTCEKS